MCVRNALATLAAWLLARQRRALLDDRDRWLGEAVDHADLERRMRSLDRCGWKPPC